MGNGLIIIGLTTDGAILTTTDGPIGGSILTTTHGFITVGLTIDGAILTTTYGPIVIGVRRKVIGGPILTTIYGLIIVGITIDGPIHGPKSLGYGERSLVGLSLPSILREPLHQPWLLSRCITCNQHQRVQLSQRLYTRI